MNTNKAPLSATLIIDDKSFSMTLNDSQSAKELYDLLPLNIDMYDLNCNEKYRYLNQKITSNPQRINTINQGEIMLFGDDCLVIFYESFDTTYSYTRLGKINDSKSFYQVVSNRDIQVSIIK